MLQVAGVDLLHYGARESKVWESLQSGNSMGFEEIDNRQAFGPRRLQLKRLLYAPTPADWGFEFCRIPSVRVLQLQNTPGTYPGGCDIPDRILWMPAEVEETEGLWKVIESKTLVSAPVDSRQKSFTSEPFLELVDDTQDDGGVIALVQQRATMKREEELRHRPRSRSQPPILRRREVAYYAQQDCSRGWLGPCHLCPFDSRWRFHSQPDLSCGTTILHDNCEWRIFDVRSCARGLSHLETSLQASWRWRASSFLGDVAQCYIAEKGHTGNDDCPWGCSKVSLNQLHVPEPLRPYHPRRWQRRFLI